MFGFTCDATGENLPGKFAPWTPFKSITLERGAPPTPGVDTEACLSDIEQFGFHVADKHVRITDTLI